MAVQLVVCELKASPVRRCRQEAVGTCQYCGHHFCRGHGVFLDDEQEICSRRICQSKMADVARHLLYKQAVARRNADDACGVEDCQAVMSGQCSRCRGLFCAGHLHAGTITVHTNGRQERRPGSVCGHCGRRQALWTRK